MPPKKAIKLLPNQSKLNTFLNLNKHVSTVNDVNNNNDKNTNNNDQSQSEASADGPQSHVQNQKQRKIQRHFQSRWLSIYSWLRLEKEEYDEYMYCTYAPTMTK